MRMIIEPPGRTRGNRSMSRSARQRVNRNARRMVKFLLSNYNLVYRRRLYGLIRADGPLDAATLRLWIANRPHIMDVNVGSGVTSAVGDAAVEVNWEYAAEMVNRKMKTRGCEGPYD